MSANIEGMVRSAIEAIRAGNKVEARVLLEKALELDEYNEEAWLWLSGVVENRDEQRTCLENVLVVNPNNERALSGLKALGVDPGKRPAPVEEAAPSAEHSPFTDMNFDEALATSFDLSGDETEADDAWDEIIATSSASSNYRGPELSKDDYDNWVDSLGLAAGEEPPAVRPGMGTSADNLAQMAASSGVFDQGYDPDNDDDGFTDLSRSGTIADDYSDAYSPTPDEDEYVAPRQPDYATTFEIDEDDQIDLSRGYSQEYLEDEDMLDEMSRADSADFIFSEDEPEGETDLDHLFSAIPVSVKPTRLPGTVESVGLAPKALVAVLAVLNVAAIAFVITQVMG